MSAFERAVVADADGADEDEPGTDEDAPAGKGNRRRSAVLRSSDCSASFGHPGTGGLLLVVLGGLLVRARRPWRRTAP